MFSEIPFNRILTGYLMVYVFGVLVRIPIDGQDFRS